MKVLVYCASVLWCLVTAQESRHYHLHSSANTRTLENDPKLDVFLQNQRGTQSHHNFESQRTQFSKYTGGILQSTHGVHEAPLRTDQARDIIHFPQHPTQANTEQTNKNLGRQYEEFSFDRSHFREPTNGQTERHNTQGFGEFRINSNTSQPNGLGDLKIARGNGQNTFQIHSIGQPKVTRTVYINGVRVEDNSEEHVASIISALLNPHLQYTTSASRDEGSQYDHRGLLDVNQLANSNHQQNNGQVPSYILGHSNNYNRDSEYSNSKNYHNQIPSIDIRMGAFEHHISSGRLAKLREKGRYITNATSVYNKRHLKHRMTEDRIIFM